MVGLVLLLVLTILGVSAMRGTTLQERMAGNMQDRELAFQAAEAALRAGEVQLDGATLPAFGTATGYYKTSSSATSSRWESIYGVNVAPLPTDSVVKCADITACGNVGNLAASFFIEKLQNVVLPGNSLGNNPGPSPSVYRVTAQGSGQSPGTAVVLQSTYIR